MTDTDKPPIGLGCGWIDYLALIAFFIVFSVPILTVLSNMDAITDFVLSITGLPPDNHLRGEDYRIEEFCFHEMQDRNYTLCRTNETWRTEHGY